jgi:hypothetical protein
MRIEGLFVGLVIVAWLLWRQLQVRELRSDRNYRAPLIMSAVGVIEIVRYGNEHPLGATGIAPRDAARIGGVSLLLYLGISLAVQRAALGERARRLG